MRNLAKDKAMCEAASGGPWRQSHNTVTDDVNYRNVESKHGYFSKGKKGTGFKLTGYVSPADAHFIAESRQALPYWIAHYEAAQARIVELDNDRMDQRHKVDVLCARIAELKNMYRCECERVEKLEDHIERIERKGYV